MGDSFIPYGSDPATVGRRSAASSRSETRDGATATFYRDEVHIVDRKGRTFNGVGATFRIPGSAATPQPLWSIENTTGSTVRVELSRLVVGVAQTGANTTMPPWFYLFRTTTMPTGGQTIYKMHPDGSSAQTSVANVTIRQGASADGSLATSALTAAFVAPRLSTMFGSQLYTAVGHSTPLRFDLLAGVSNDPLEHGELVLAAGQALVLHVATAAAADNIATRSFLVDFAWNEHTLY